MGSPAKGDAAPQAEDQLTGKLPGPIVALLQFCDEAALHPGGHIAHCTLVTLHPGHTAHCSIAPWSHQLCLQLQHRLPSAASPWEAMAALMAPMMASRIGSLWRPSLPPTLPPTERMLRSCIGDYPAPRKLPRPYLLERELAVYGRHHCHCSRR